MQLEAQQLNFSLNSKLVFVLLGGGKEKNREKRKKVVLPATLFIYGPCVTAEDHYK